MSLSFILTRNKKIEYYIRIKIHKPIILNFWIQSGVNALCSLVYIILVLYTACLNLTWMILVGFSGDINVVRCLFCSVQFWPNMLCSILLYLYLEFRVA